LFNKVVIDSEKDLYFNNQLVNHLYEFRTFNEGDFFQNGVLDERLFIMTIHKSKGLEFDNVILYDITHGKMPRYNSRSLDEDARVLYVAMSRAKKRLYITYENKVSEFLGDYDQVMEHFVEMHPEKKAKLLNFENILVNSLNSTD
jgi:DNA helicase II / ATP-dependent DNA helicase PcrA